MGARRLLSIAVLAALALTFGPTVTYFTMPSVAAPAYLSQARAYLPLVMKDPTPTPYTCNQRQQGLGNGGFENGPLNVAPWIVCGSSGCSAPTITSQRASVGAFSAQFDSGGEGLEQGGVAVPSWTEAAWLKLDFYVETTPPGTQTADTLAIDIFDDDTGATVASAAIGTQWQDSWYVGRMNLASPADYQGHHLRVRFKTSAAADATRWFVDQIELNFACGPGVLSSPDQAGVFDLGEATEAR